MKKFLSTLVTASLIVLGLAPGTLAAHASAPDPTIDVTPTFSVTGNTLAITRSSSWNNGSTNPIVGSVVEQFYACQNPVNSGSSNNASPNNFLNFLSCGMLTTDAAGTIPFNSGDITTAYIDNGGGTVAYTQRMANASKITLISSVLTNANGGLWYYANTSSVDYTYTQIVPSITQQPTLGISGSTLTFTPGAWDAGQVNLLMYACPTAQSVITVPSTAPAFIQGCLSLFDGNSYSANSYVTDLNSAWVQGMGGFRPYNPSSDPTFIHLVSNATVPVNQFYNVRTASVAYGSVSGGNSSGSSPSAGTQTLAPSYTGPKISSFNLGSVAPGGSLVATGKKLDQIQSATIGDKSATLTHSDNRLAIGVPADLAPGTYNLVMQTSYGSLTQLNAVVVKTPKPVSSFTLKGTGPAISSDLASEIKAIGSMYSADYSKIHCVVNTTDEEAAAIATQACSLLKTGSLSAATTLTTLKSTFKGSGFWLRVYLAG